MTSQTSAVLVAVRVRPFNSREAPHECTVTVTDPRTITLTDVGQVNRFSTSVSGSMQRHVFTFDKIFWSVPSCVLPLPTTPSGHSQQMPSASSIRLSVADSSPSTHSPSPTESPTVRRSSNSSDASVPCAAPTAEVSVSAITCLRPSFHRLPCFAQTPSCDDQTSVYSFIGPLMYDSVMTGYNSCLFAYGQTGSGKTYSMIGPHDSFSEKGDQRGIIQRLCEDLFDMMRREREEDEGISYNVECSFLEIYCERVRDLLTHTTFHSTNDDYSAPNVTTMGPPSNLRSKTSPSQSLVLTPRQGSSNPSPQLRIRQHPTHGPYVEGLSHVKVRDVEGVMHQLTCGMRERATAETRMNEHSSRSHALLQLNITRVSAVREEEAVVTRTRVCKVSLVDLAGSERISQSGATGDRFEEARNINLSLTTLTRVIMQLTDKQAGKNVVPSYRDSALTWLLSDSLGGNSKTIMLATVAPSAYCYQQTLNTLRFAGVAKTVINVATVNEDQRFQKLITSLREQIVKLTMQVEEGRILDPQNSEMRKLRRDKGELETQLEAMRIKVSKMVPATDLEILRRRVAETEEENTRLHAEKCNLQRQLMTTTTNLREELIRRRSEIVKLQEMLSKKDVEVQEWKRRHHSEVLRGGKATPQSTVQLSRGRAASGGRAASPSGAFKFNNSSKCGMLKTDVASISSDSIVEGDADSGCAAVGELQFRNQQLERRVEKLTESVKEEQKRREDVEKVNHNLRFELRELQKLRDATRGQLEEAQRRLTEKSHALEAAESDLASTRTLLSTERNGSCASEREALLTTQLEDLRVEYLGEKQSNVGLLMRVSHMEQQLFLSQQEAEIKSRDVGELEQMLLEETETSERYYIFQLYYSGEANICHAFHQKILLVKSLEPTNSVGVVTGVARRSSFSDGPNVCVRALRDCECNEGCKRLLLVEEWFNTVLDLAAQRHAMWRWSASALSDEILSLRINFAEGEEKQQRLLRKLETAEISLEEAIAVRNSVQATLSTTVEQCEELKRQVEDLKEELQAQQQRNEMLITRIAEVQAVRDVFGEPSLSVDDPVSGLTLDGRGEEYQRFSRGSGERSLEDLSSEMTLYKERVDMLSAQLESERNRSHDLQVEMERELEIRQQEVQRVKSSCKASLFESTQIVREYEARLQELQDVIETLRTALAEESNNVDIAQEEVRQAKVRHCTLTTELHRVVEVKESLERRLEDTELQFSTIQQEQQKLKREFCEVERRLLDLSQMHEADVYLNVRCGGEDSEWLEKAAREKEAIEQQKRLVQKLNKELLEAITEQKASLLDMDRQIALMQRGATSHNGEANLTQESNGGVSQFQGCIDGEG